MTEYIEKEAIKEAFKETFAYGQNENFANCLERVACEIVDKVAVADVQSVVYCKNCKHARYQNDTKIYCTYFGVGSMSQDDFCSQGERNTKNDT